MKTIERKKTRNISISVSLDKFDSIENFIKSKWISRSELVDKALESYMKEKINEKLREWYEKMWQDKDYLDEMVENSQLLSYL